MTQLKAKYHKLILKTSPREGLDLHLLPFPEAIVVQAKTSTTTQSAGRRVYRNSIICENKREVKKEFLKAQPDQFSLHRTK